MNDEAIALDADDEAVEETWEELTNGLGDDEEEADGQQ